MDGVNASHALYRLSKLVTVYSGSMDAAGVPLAEAMPAVWDRYARVRASACARLASTRVCLGVLRVLVPPECVHMSMHMCEHAWSVHTLEGSCVCV